MVDAQTPQAGERPTNVGPGLVSLVGAGPGDPGLITVKGLERLRSADVVIYDRLVAPRLLVNVQPSTELIDAGKGRGSARMTQEEINLALVEKARLGKRVCRLKGGDPFVFGRGGEEALALSQAGIPWEVVPGVTSAVAAAAYAGIPVTHRGVAASFSVVTGSEAPRRVGPTVDWEALARAGGTLIFLMGWEALDDIVKTLLAHGVPPARPAAAVQWGTTPRQRVVIGPLSDIAGTALGAGLGAPVALVVGDVVSLREQLAWFDRKPLFGKRVLVTRARSQASRLRQILESHGAECVEFPAIQIGPVSDPAALDTALRHIGDYDWATFTSPNGVKAVRQRMDALDLDARAWRGVKVAAVGPATAQALREMGVRPDLVPADYLAAAVVSEFKKSGLRPSPGTGRSTVRAVHFKSDIGRETLPDGLRKLGAEVDEVIAYETRSPEDSGEKARAAFLPENGGIDITTFSSSSAVKNLHRLLGPDSGLVNGTLVACMGPMTAAAAQGLGIRVDVVAGEQSIEGFVKSVVGKVQSGAKA